MSQNVDLQSPDNTTPAKNAPGPKSVPVLGNILDIRRAGGLIQFYVDANKQYGDIVRLQMGPLVSHLIVHPDSVRQVLVTNRQNYWKGNGMRKVKLVLGDGLFTSEGEIWQRHRKLMQPMFTPRGVAHFAPLMVDIISRTLQRWDAYTARGETFDVNQEMMRLAMGVIAATMFNIDITQDAVEAAGAFTYVLDFISSHTMSFVDLPLWVPTPDNRRFNQSTETLRRFMENIIRSRRAELERGQTADRRPDLLDMLLTAKDEETGQGMSDKQIYDEVLTIFFAGHETTAQALTWTWYLLSQHPEVESQAARSGRRSRDRRSADPPTPWRAWPTRAWWSTKPCACIRRCGSTCATHTATTTSAAIASRPSR